MGKNSKRPKSYYLNSAKRKKPNSGIDSDMMGFLCTCNNNEKDCVREAYNVLNEFADSEYGPESISKESETTAKDTNKDKNSVEASNTQSSDSDSDDVETSLKDEIEALKKSKTDSRRRFQQKSVPVNNCIFISSTVPDPVQLSLSIMDSILERKEARTKNLVRMVPVQATCKAFTKDIEKAAKELIFAKFPKKPVSYYVVSKIRNNGAVKREALMKALSDIISEYNLEAVADYKTPDIVLNVDIVKNYCCLGLLPDYLTKYCRYNLLMLAQPGKKNEEKILEGGQVTSQKEVEVSKNDTELAVHTEGKELEGDVKDKQVEVSINKQTEEGANEKVRQIEEGTNGNKKAEEGANENTKQIEGTNGNTKHTE